MQPGCLQTAAVNYPLPLKALTGTILKFQSSEIKREASPWDSPGDQDEDLFFYPCGTLETAWLGYAGSTVAALQAAKKGLGHPHDDLSLATSQTPRPRHACEVPGPEEQENSLFSAGGTSWGGSSWSLDGIGRAAGPAAG